MNRASVKMKNVRLRLIEVEDAEFVLGLRLDERKGRYLSTVSDDVEKQRQWIRDYKAREALSREFYFIIVSREGEKYGAVRVYDMHGGSFSWGSWILSADAPRSAAIESALAVYEFAFCGMNCEVAEFEVVTGNDRVIAFHERFGARRTSEDDEKVYFGFTRESYDEVRIRYSRFFETC